MIRNSNRNDLTFWDHLDVLRASLLRILAVISVAAIVLFCLKDQLFSFVLAPADGSFCTYRWLGADDMDVRLINTGLTRQFAAHVHMAFYAATALVFPYILFELFLFVAPGLYERESRYVRAVMLGGTAMFYLGAALAYWLIFPVSLRFLATYQVSADVPNIITLDSYISTMLSLLLTMGIVSELPVALWLAGRMGLVRRHLLRQYRRHVIVALLAVAAIVTPTTDALTLMLVTIPLVALYELGVLVVPE